MYFGKGHTKYKENSHILTVTLKVSLGAQRGEVGLPHKVTNLVMVGAYGMYLYQL